MNKFVLSVTFVFFISSCSTLQQSNQAIGLLYQGLNIEAWNMITDTMLDIDKQPLEDRCETQIAYLQILSTLARHKFIPKGADQQAKETFDTIKTQCTRYPKKVIIAYNRYAMYFLTTYRPGLGLPYAQKAIDLSDDYPFEKLSSISLLGSIYLDMGEIEIFLDSYQKSFEWSKKYFESNRTYTYQLDEFNEWNTLLDNLKIYMDIVAIHVKPENAKIEIDAIIPLAESINNRWLSYETQYVLYNHMAQVYIFANDSVNAKKSLSRAKQYVNSYSGNARKTGEVDILYSESLLHFHQKDYTKSATLMSKALNNFELITQKNIPIQWLRMASMVYEQAGDLEKAENINKSSIQEMEKVRASFGPDKRGKFYNTESVKAYWSQMRINAKQFLTNQSTSDFNEFLRSIAYYKSRSANELTNTSNVPSVSDIQSALGKINVFIDFESTGDETIVTYITRDWYHIKIFDQSLQDIATKLVLDIHKHRNSNSIFEALNILGRTLFNEQLVNPKITKNILISPDGVFNLIPYSALFIDSLDYKPLGLQYTFHMLSSPSAVINSETSNQDGNTDIMVLSDPIFNSPEKYIRQLNPDLTLSNKQLQKLSRNEISALPETRIEARQIAEIFGHQNVTSLFQENATEDWLKENNLTHYKYMHFSTHGTLRGDFPGLFEPALLLSSSPNNDGLLTSSEISELNLSTDLVVLSACNTAVDRYNRGDSIMGLARAFKIAGADSIVATLWPIPSKPTVKFMEFFYSSLSAGLSTKDSLSSAQRAFINAKQNQLPPEFALPYYWAAFTLY
ncbi:MAG: CHAT domain-containing protein [Candidatus Thiodiazotropha taylori]|nr:CHAT domain-containing protein [Candidatus Thiodiazotropha endolucinida]MCW4229648.1 CHAT domain-containing protein [Candidatus Thiodiazotropha taylori]